MVLDRTKAPPIHENIDVQIPKTHHFILDNGLQVFEVNMGTQNILKLEIVFNAGRIFESKKLSARTTASLLKEATSKYSSSRLAEKIDFYGATIESNSNWDNSTLVLLCLKKHFEKLLAILANIWEDSIFPEEELDKYKRKVKQQLKINLAKNEVIAYRELTKEIFGPDHPYGFNSTEKLYNAITRQDMLDHYKRFYFRKDTRIFISGLIDKKHRKLLNRILGSIELNSPEIKPVRWATIKDQPQKNKILGEQEYQTAIRIGKKLFNRSNDDYASFYFMNIILGGYFGSRLMKNIREDKAYTYGIHSYMDMLRYDGYFSISTEVGNEYLEPTLEEIYKEIERMKSDLVSDHEFTMARNYLLGQFLNMMDGPLKVSQILKVMVSSGNDLDFIKKMIHRIKETTKEEIRDLAIKYLKVDELWEIVAGNKIH